MQPCAWAVHDRRQNPTCLAFCRASSFSVFTRASWYSLKHAFFSPSDFRAEYLHIFYSQCQSLGRITLLTCSAAQKDGAVN